MQLELVTKLPGSEGPFPVRLGDTVAMETVYGYVMYSISSQNNTE